MILLYLSDLADIAQTQREIGDYVAGRLRRPMPLETDRALRELATLGYVARCEPTADSEPMWKITSDGLRQAQRKVSVDSLDPAIWGN